MTMITAAATATGSPQIGANKQRTITTTEDSHHHQGNNVLPSPPPSSSSGISGTEESSTSPDTTVSLCRLGVSASDEPTIISAAIKFTSPPVSRHQTALNMIRRSNSEDVQRRHSSAYGSAAKTGHGPSTVADCCADSSSTSSLATLLQQPPSSQKVALLEEDDCSLSLSLSPTTTANKATPVIDSSNSNDTIIERSNAATTNESSSRHSLADTPSATAADNIASSINFVDDRRSKERPNNSLKNHEDDETTTASYYKPEQMVHYNTPHNYNAHNAGKLRYNPAVAGNVVFVDPSTQQQHLLPPPMLFMPTPPDCNRYFGTAYNGIPIDASSMMPMQGGQTQTSPGHDSGGMIVDPSSIQGPQHHQQFPTGVPPGVLPPPHQHFAACSGSMYGAAPSGAVLPPPGIPPPPPLHLLPAHVQSQIAAAFSQAPPPGMYFPMPSAAPGGPLGKHHQQDAMNCCWPTNQPPHSLLGLPTMPPTMQPPPPSATSGAPHQQVGSQCQPMRPQSSYYTLCTELVATALAAAQAAAAGYHVTSEPNINAPSILSIAALPETAAFSAPPSSEGQGHNGASGGEASNEGNLQPNGNMSLLQQQMNSGNIPPGIAAALNGGHDLFVHIHPGDCISLAVGNDVQQVHGPATIRMVSQAAPPPSIPMNVPPDHIVQQLIDRQGMLSHIIVSQEAVNHVPSMPTGMVASAASPIPSSTPPYVKNQRQTHSVSPQHRLHQEGSAETDERAIVGEGNGMNTSRDFRQQQKGLPWHHHKTGSRPQTANGQHQEVAGPTAEIPATLPTMQMNAAADSFIPTANQLDVVYSSASPRIASPKHFPVHQKKVQPTVATSVNDTEHEEELSRVRDMLSSISPVSIVRVFAREAEIVWNELDTSEAGASGGPFPQIDASEFQYELFVFECNGTQQMQKNVMIQKCAAGAQMCCLTMLKPATDYQVTIRASLPERGIYGSNSAAVEFRTNPCQPDPPSMPKLIMRQANLVQVQWRPPNNNGSSISAYHLQIARGRGEPFTVVYDGPNEQARITGLEPGSYYRLRVMATNDFGDSDFSPQLNVYPFQNVAGVVGTVPTPSSSPSSFSAGSSGMGTAANYHHAQTLKPTSAKSPSSLSPRSRASVPVIGVGIGTEAGLVPKPDPPTIHSVSTRGCRLSWTLPGPNIDPYSVVLEMCDARYASSTSGSNFVPIPDEFYASSRTFANVLDLVPSREYRFRLSIGGGQQQLYSEFVSVRTHRDFRSYAPDGSSSYYSAGGQEVHHRPYHHQQDGGAPPHRPYYQRQMPSHQQQQFHTAQKQQHVQQQQQQQQQQPTSMPHPVIVAKKPAAAEQQLQQQLQSPRKLQRLHDNGECLEIGWKYGGSGSSSAMAEHISFIVEGSCAAPSALFSFTDEATVAETELPSLDEPWQMCYKGQALSCTVYNTRLSLFRVRATSASKGYKDSDWSDILVLKRKPRSEAGSRQDRTPSSGSSAEIITEGAKVRAGTTQQKSATSSVKSQSQQPSQPQKPPSFSGPPRLIALSSRAIKITWQPVAGAGSPKKNGTSSAKNAVQTAPDMTLLYELQRVDSARPPTIIYSGNDTEFEQAGLKPSEHIQVRVRAVYIDSEGKRIEGDWSNIGSTCTHCAVSSPPRNVHIEDEGHHTMGEKTASKSANISHTLFLTWDLPERLNGSCISEYIIQTNGPLNSSEEAKGKKEFSNFLASTPGDVTRFNATPHLKPGHYYAFHVLAVNDAGKSEASECTRVIQTPSAAPEAPTNLKAEPLSTTELQLEWSPSSSENGSPVTAYHIDVFRVDDSDISIKRQLVSQNIVPVAENELIIQALEAETEYEIVLRAENAIGKGAKTTAISRTFSQPPEPPQLHLVQAQANQLKLKWGSQNVGTLVHGRLQPYYYFLEKENENGTFSPVYEGEMHTAKVRGLREQTVHRFRIRAAVGGRTGLVGPWSDPKEFTTVAQPPPSVRHAPNVTELGSEQFQIEWVPIRTISLHHQLQQQQQENGGGDQVDSLEGQQKQFFYRLQVAIKPSARDKTSTAELWKTVYEGNETIYALTVSSALTRQARVIVVQQNLCNGSIVEECVSAPSPVAVFSAGMTPTTSQKSDSPKKNTTGTNASGRNVRSLRGSPSSSGGGRVSLNKRLRRISSWLRKTVSEKDCALIVLTIFVLIALGIVYMLNNYYQI